MNIVRVEKTKNYTIMHNEFLRSKELSLKAIGLLAKILALPDDWDFTIEGICKCVKESQTAVRSAIKELQDTGYCTIEQQKLNGKFGAVVYTFYECRNDVLPLTENPHAENPHTENVRQINTNIINNNITNNLNNNKEKIKKESLQLDFVSAELREAFELWLDYKHERGQSYKQRGAALCYKKLMQLSGGDATTAMAIVEQSIANNYQGLFELKNTNNNGTKRNYQTATERLRQEYADGINSILEKYQRGGSDGNGGTTEGFPF